MQHVPHITDMGWRHPFLQRRAFLQCLVVPCRCIQPDHLSVLALPVAEFLALLHHTSYLGYSQRSSQQGKWWWRWCLWAQWGAVLSVPCSLFPVLRVPAFLQSPTQLTGVHMGGCRWGRVWPLLCLPSKHKLTKHARTHNPPCAPLKQGNAEGREQCMPNL